MKLKDGLDKYKNLPRDQYFEKNQELSKKLWEKEDLPTVADIADFMKNGYNPKMQNIFDFFDNKDEFTKMASRTTQKYDQDESSAFMKKVMSANSDEISEAGYFYKLLMASADDFRIKEKDCESEGKLYQENDINNLNEEDYNYRIKCMYINEFDNFCNLDFKEFKEKIISNNLKQIHVRTPLTCKHSKNHGICRKCAGMIPKNVNNIGTFTTLCVTEHVTQGALSSMNKGVKENINNILTTKYNGDYDWGPISQWIYEITEKLKNDKVQARYYEIALLSRVRQDEFGPFVASMKGSINYSGNKFGQYIFTPNIKNLEKLVKMGSFNDNSLKLKIAMNDFSDKTEEETNN